MYLEQSGVFFVDINIYKGMQTDLSGVFYAFLVLYI